MCFQHFDLHMCFAPQRRAIFLTSNLQKVVRTRQFFRILTWKCASRHSRVPLLNIGTSKMALRMWCFVHFDLNMCFAPQPRAIFEHWNFQNGSANEVFCAFWLANVLRATAARHFSPVCQNSYLRTRRFSEPTFRTSGTTNHWKNTAIRDVLNIFRTCSFFLVTLHACGSPFCWLDISILCLTPLLCFSTLHIVGS